MLNYTRFGRKGITVVPVRGFLGGTGYWTPFTINFGQSQAWLGPSAGDGEVKSGKINRETTTSRADTAI